MKLIPNLADIDRKAIRQAGIPAETLMEAAGTRVAQAVENHCGASQKGVIVCGPGNNGGDGFVCARKLYQSGFHSLTVIYTGSGYKNEVLANFEQVLIGLPITVIDARKQTEAALAQIAQADFIVDALFGSGLARPIENLEARLIEAMSQALAHRQNSRPWMLAVDLPSGIDSATGQILGCAVHADATVTFAAAKPGLFLYPGKAHAGQCFVVDIGIPASLVEEDESPVRLITQETARSWLPLRKPESHKYSHGHVLVIAGSQRMPGAAVLCSEAAMSAGAGLITLAAPANVFSQLPIMPEIIRLPLPDEATLTQTSIPVLEEALASKRYSAVVIGPGLGDAPGTFAAITALLEKLKGLNLPIIVDADGLNALSETPLQLNERFILTPHIGECARLLKQENSHIMTDMLAAAQEARSRYQAHIVLKSAATVVASLEALPEPALCWISPTGNAGMATAGSGDVLSGTIGAMAAQRQAQDLSVGPAAPLGVYLHGFAGDAAAETFTPYAMRASDITRHLPQAFKRLLS